VTKNECFTEQSPCSTGSIGSSAGNETAQRLVLS
jgi:hypothetical protein